MQAKESTTKMGGHIQTKSLSSYDAYVFSACSDDRSWTRQAVVSRLSDDPSALGWSSLESVHDAVHHDMTMKAMNSWIASMNSGTKRSAYDDSNRKLCHKQNGRLFL
jgi:hypothetical protein